MANPGEWIARINKIDDKKAISLVKAIAKIFTEEPPQINFQLFTGLDLTFDDIEEKKFKSGTYSLWQINWGLPLSSARSVTVTFHRRSMTAGTDAIDPHYDELKISYTKLENWRKHTDELLAVQNVVRPVLVPLPTNGEVEGTDILRELIVQNDSTHRGMMEQLNNSVQEMIAKRRELETEAAEAELARDAAHKIALDELDRERQELQRQSHMSERRKIAASIGMRLSDAARQSTKPKGVQATGWAVFVASLLVGVAGLVSLTVAVMAYQARADAALQVAAALREYSQGLGADGTTPDPAAFSFDAATDWYLIIRSVVSSIVAVGGFTYAAAWMKRYYDEDMRLLRELERFNDDVQRASWIVEAVHEVKHEAKGELPVEWVEAVTRNLFDRGGQSRGDDGVEALRALMGFTASASFGPEGPRFDIGRRGARRMNQADTNSTEE